MLILPEGLYLGILPSTKNYENGPFPLKITKRIFSRHEFIHL